MNAERIEHLAVLRLSDYIRQRLEPQPGDPAAYLVLSDLRLALERIRTDAQVRVLDFGAGGSPYRSLFTNSAYARADLGDSPELDYRISEVGTIEEQDAMFDLLLSTQVVEHVADPAQYFAESFRLLRPGGQIVCTTHGLYEDHGCPYDFQRWTAYGLERDLRHAGFVIDSTVKLTTGSRALMFLLERGFLRAPRRSILGFTFFVMRGLFRLFRAQIHQLCDRTLDENRVVTDRLDDHILYIGLMVTAHKPE